MRVWYLLRTGPSGPSLAGYARQGVTITVTREQAEALLAHGGWVDVTTDHQRATEVPTGTPPTAGEAEPKRARRKRAAG